MAMGRGEGGHSNSHQHPAIECPCILRETAGSRNAAAASVVKVSSKPCLTHQCPCPALVLAPDSATKFPNTSSSPNASSNTSSTNTSCYKRASNVSLSTPPPTLPVPAMPPPLAPLKCFLFKCLLRLL